MKKRLLSLVLCLVMVFSLLPTFGVPALAADQEGIETADGYAQAGDRTSWNMNQVQDWTNNYITYAPYADDGRLYVKVGDKYYEVQIKSDPDYHGNKTQKTIGDGFLLNMAGEKDYFWEQDNQEWCYVDDQGNMHQLYYNSYYADNGLTGNDYHIEAYFYANPLDQGVNIKGASSDDNAADANFQAAVNSGRVLLFNADGTPDTDNTKTRWRFGYGSGWHGTPSGKTNKLYVSSFKHDANNKNAMYYEIGGTRYYMVRNTTSATNPATTAWSGKLYYKVDENMIIDPETVQVQDSDRGEYTVTVENNNTITNPARANENGLKLSKELAYNTTSEAFDLTMESYSTVNVDKTNVTEKIPTDFVVVVDQSGSMDYTDMPVSYDKTIKQVDLETIGAAAEETPGSTNANGYYYKADDGNYYRVYPVKDYLFHYFEPNYWYVGDIIDRLGTNLGWFMGSTDSTSTFQNQFYFREEINGEGHYQPITMTVTGRTLRYDIVFSYTSELPGASNPVKFNRNEKSYSGAENSPWYKNFATGKTMTGGALYWVADRAVKAISGDDTWYTYAELGVDTGMFVNYPMYERKVGYTKLVYRDVNGVEHVVPTSSGLEEAEFCDGSGNAVTTKEATTRMWYNNLYTYHKATNTSRETALKYALNQFLTALANEKDTKNKALSSVDNRVAIVGFSSSGYNTTEVMTGESISAGGGVTKSTADNNVATYYGGALLSATNNGQIGAVNPKLTAAVNSITANGGTQPELGLNMAKQILDNRSVTDYTMVTGEGGTVKRNTIVIFFTDGRPGDYKESNQYAEANEVVQEALNIKHLKDGNTDLNTKIFSIGVFGEADGNPLTYNANNEYAYDNQGNRVRISSMNSGNWEYLGGWVETYEGKCLRRQWRAHNADYTPEANDTIFDYMSVVSSNYPDAENFIAPAWLAGNFNGTYVAATNGVRHIDTAESTNKYYRMASNQDTLVKAFREAVTIAGSIVEGSSGATSLDDMAKFEDKIDTENFDVSEATYSVWWQPIKVLDSAVPTVGYEGTTMIANNGDAVLKVDKEPVPDTGIIDYTGFNYSENYVSKMKDEGYKLVVKVEGLKPLEYNQPMNSNADPSATEFACGIYPYGSNEARISIKSPVVTVFKVKSAYVADFNAPLIIAKNATVLSTTKDGASVNSITGKNGVFSLKSNNDAVYQLNSGTLADNTTTINIAYTDADSAWITGEHVDDGEGAPAAQEEVVVIPGSSIYFDDDLKNGNPITIGDGSGYNSAVSVSPNSTEAGKGTISITFNGTGIDVYCTTDDPSGYMQAKCDGANVVTMRNQSNTTRYNVPTISYTGLTNGQHTVTLTILTNSHYKLDGVRVYNPVQDQTLYTDNDKSEEANAVFLNLREALINDETHSNGDVSISDDSSSALAGALYVDDSSKLQQLVTATEADLEEGSGVEIVKYVDAEGNEVDAETDGAIAMKRAYASDFAAYEANSPKNEIYLSNGQGVIFQLTNAACGGQLWIGLSAPDAGKNSGSVIITTDHAETVNVTSGVDMYYPIDLGDSSTVTIVNNGTNMISVTNLKITGVASIYAAANADKAVTSSVNEPLASALSVEDAMSMVFEPVTMKTVRMAVNNGVDPEAVEVPDEPEVPETPAPTETPAPEVTPDPTPTPEVTPEPTQAPSIQDIVKQIVSSFVSSLFKSVSRLFGN